MKYIYIIVLFSLALCGCSTNEETIDIALEEVMCPCDHEVDIWEYPFLEKNILLFDAAKTSLEDMKKISFDSKDGGSRFIIMGHESEQALYIRNHYNMGYICNFPEMLDWNIPSTGLRISCSGDVFATCESKVGIPEYFYSNIVLTSLKIHTK